jgi:hypothetical protein
MAATNLSALLPLAGRAPTGAIQVPRAGAGGNTTLPGLPSETNYTLLLAARDVTQPSPNYLPRLQALALAAPDVTPPVFTGERGAVAHALVCAARCGGGIGLQRALQCPAVLQRTVP